MKALSSNFNDTPQLASRPLDKARDGFVFSGGSGILVLEDMETAKARGARIHAVIAGAAASCDGDHMVAPNGIGADQAIRSALADAEVSADKIDYINLHGTSTPVGDVAELEATVKVFGRSSMPKFSSTKSMTGHALGAAGVQEAIFCMLMMQDQFLAANINLDDADDMVGDMPIIKTTEAAKPFFALSNSFGFGGTNCSLVIAKEPF
jgi:3-oxoacyl-[acyl-carrier-protein] synthase-1